MFKKLKEKIPVQKAGGGLVYNKNGEILFIFRNGKWDLPKGGKEKREKMKLTAMREVEEETGVQVGDVRYVASQPWPFPSSLMLGFNAIARTHEIHLRDGELEDARWFTRADIAAGHPALPPTGSISARLIDGWFGQPGGPAARG
jgi:NAD+ diphosphatase